MPRKGRYSGPDLFNHRAYARRDDPQTSKDAAALVPVTQLEADVLRCYHRHGPNGLTAHEVERFTGMKEGSCTPRMRPLIRAGLLEERFDEFGKALTRVPRGYKRGQNIRYLVKGRLWEGPPEKPPPEPPPEPSQPNKPTLDDVVLASFASTA